MQMTLCVLCICISSKPSPRARSRFCSFKLQFTVLRLPFCFFFVSSLRCLSRRQHSSLYFLSPFVSSLIRTWGYEVTRRSISLVYVYLPTYLVPECLYCGSFQASANNFAVERRKPPFETRSLQSQIRQIVVGRCKLVASN